MAPPPPSDTEIGQLIEDQLSTAIISTETLRSGAWSSAIAILTIGGEYVLRFSQTGDDFRCDQLASKFRSPHLPIPRVIGIGEVADRWWCISERMPGSALDDSDSAALERTLPSIASMLIAMRNVDARDTTGYGGWDSDGNGRFASFADQLMDVASDNPNERGGGWRAILSQHPYEHAVFERGVKELDRLCGYISGTRQLIHQDTLNYNVVVQDDMVSGIFDWGCAMWGDALYDLAWFRFWNPWYPQWNALNIPARLESIVGIDGENSQERMRCYLLHIGLMHIRYNAFIGDIKAMNEVAMATEKLL